MTRGFVAMATFLSNLTVRHVVIGVAVFAVLIVTLGVTIGFTTTAHMVPLASGTAWTNGVGTVGGAHLQMTSTRMNKQASG